MDLLGLLLFLPELVVVAQAHLPGAVLPAGPQAGSGGEGRGEHTLHKTGSKILERQPGMGRGHAVREDEKEVLQEFAASNLADRTELSVYLILKAPCKLLRAWKMKTF